MKHIGLTILMVIGFCFTNCSNDDLNCGNFESRPFFDIQSLEELRHYSVLDNIQKVLEDSSTVQLNEYAGLSMWFDVEYIVNSQKSNYDFSIINTLLACTPEPQGLEGSKEEKMESLEVITLNDFDADHLSGSSIIDLLTLQEFEYDSPVSEVKTISEYLDQNELIKTERIFLKPTKAPELNQDFQVQVKVQLTGGEMYEVTSNLVKLVN